MHRHLHSNKNQPPGLTRRSLLDELFREDGQSLSSLRQRLPMTRFGVMKHLKLLEEAGLVVTRRRGREKLHFLNTVPIRLVHDRWVNKYTEPWVATLSDLKQRLEDRTMEKIFEIYIKTTPEHLWQAITDREMRRKYNFGAIVTSSWVNGSRYEGVGQGTPIFEGENLEVDPPHRLVQSFRALWGEDVKSEGTSRVTWEIEQVGDSCRLKVTHDQLREGANNQLYGGWPMVLSGIKTLLETGEILTTPGSLRWLQAQRINWLKLAGGGEDAFRVMEALPQLARPRHPDNKSLTKETEITSCDLARGRMNMRKLTVYNSVSLDGYFTDANGDISWAHKMDPEWQAYVAENASGGGELLFGRVTYDLIASYWPTPAAQSNPIIAERMNSLPKVVFSRTLNEASWSNTRLVKGGRSS